MKASWIYQNKGLTVISLIFTITILSICLTVSQGLVVSAAKLLKITNNKYVSVYLNRKIELELQKIVKASDFQTLQIFPKIIQSKILNLNGVSEALYFYNFSSTPKLYSIGEDELVITSTGIIEPQNINKDHLILGYLPYYSIFGLYLDVDNNLRYFQIKDSKIIENQPLGIKLKSIDFDLSTNPNKTFSLVCNYMEDKIKNKIVINSKVIRQLPFNLLFNYE